MRSGWRVVGFVLPVFAVFSCAQLRAEVPGGDAQLKDDVQRERFEQAEKTLEEWRRDNLKTQAGGKPLLDDTASIRELQNAFGEAVDAQQYGIAQYYLELIRTKAENPNIFEPALDLTIWTIVVFLLLLGVLYKFAWAPMLQGLQKRETDIHSAVEDARKAREEATRLREEVQAERAKIEDMRRDVIQKAQADAQRTADEILSKAKADMQAERERALRDLETAKDQALQELWRQTADLAAMVSSKVIRRNLTPEDHRRFVDEALADIRQTGNGQKTSASV